ncbi:MAG: hypothetical protein II393_01385 [Cytophagales bacterium]|nr:hypothetical protein [Cytophagales bacterium]MBQ5918984.1 hypothetical protein [Lachnospiraceae bacterium]
MTINKRNTINKHHSSYDKATEYALRAIYEGCVIHYQCQTFEYDKQRNELKVSDFYKPASIYKPFFNAGMCDPFKELIRQEVNNDNE